MSRRTVKVPPKFNVASHNPLCLNGKEFAGDCIHVIQPGQPLNRRERRLMERALLARAKQEGGRHNG